MPNAIRKRLRLHQDWTNDIPLKNIWGINFSARTGSGAMVNVGDAIEYFLDIYRPNTYKVDNDLFDRVSDFDSGFLLAQDVKMPGLTLKTDEQSIPGSGGMPAMQYSNRIAENHKMTISFLETNRDVFSFFIQPWIVACSYAGLIEDDNEPDIKCNIDVIQYSRTAEKYGDKLGESNKRRRRNDSVEYGIRKMHTFYDCVPYQYDGDRFSYGKQSLSDITRTVGWNFAHYQLNTPRGVLNGI
jgi:hypothetical protein